MKTKSVLMKNYEFWSDNKNIGLLLLVRAY